MEVLLHLTTPEAARIAAPLGRALTAKGVRWGCFMTNDSVRAIFDDALAGALAKADRVSVCEHSWMLHMPGRAYPVEHASQTLNSALMAEARHVVSL